MLLVLGEDGAFEYFGPLNIGDEPTRVRGRWSRVGETVHLRLDEPRRSKEAAVSLLVCPWRPGVIEYPLGRDARHQVDYRLLDPRRAGDEAGGIHLGGPRTGGD